jgi:hypothetical protein
MDLDPSQDNLNGPLTPASQGLDDLRGSMEEDDPHKVRFSGGVRELTPQENDSDAFHSEESKVISADDCILPSALFVCSVLEEVWVADMV